MYDQGMVQSTAVIAREAGQERIRARTADVCARLNRAHAELVDLVAELLAGEQWAEGGIRSPEHWLVVRAGLAPARAREIVLLARRRDELPEAVAAMSAGRLGVDQAAAVARFVPADHSAAAAELAELATVPQLRRSLSRYAFPAQAPGETSVPEPGAERARLSMGTVDGRFRLTYTASAVVGALVEQAVREAKDALFNAGVVDATLADALVEVADRSLSAVNDAGRASRYRVYVHLDTTGGWVGRDGLLPSHQLDRITCDGVLQPVWETDGVPVSVGRTQRIVPERTRRLVESRDQGCRYPGCEAGGILDNHHLVHWRHGGRTDIGSLVSLCPFHHDRLHEGEFTVAGDPTRPDGLTFTTRYGWPLVPWATRAPTCPPDRAVAGRWTGPTGERLHTRWLHLAANPDDDDADLDLDSG